MGSNADRQKRYRDRKREHRNATVTVASPICSAELICSAEQIGRNKDYWQHGCQYIYLGNWGFGPQYARVVNCLPT